MSKVPGLVLPSDALATTETQVFAGFPGRWAPGVPQALAAVGLDEETAEELLAELELPLEYVDADEPDFTRHGGMVSSAEAATAPVGGELAGDDDDKYQPGYPRTHADLDALAASRAYTWPDSVRTVKEKQAALVAAGVQPDTDDDEEEEQDTDTGEEGLEQDTDTGEEELE